MCGSIRQFSMLKMKKTLIKILNGLWNKNKADRIFLEARLHLPTPASADGRGSWVLTPSTSPCRTTPDLYKINCCSHKEMGSVKCTCSAEAECTPTKASLKSHCWKTARISIPLLQTQTMFLLWRCCPGAPRVAWWEYPWERPRWDLPGKALTAPSFSHQFSWLRTWYLQVGHLFWTSFWQDKRWLSAKDTSTSQLWKCWSDAS